MVTMVENVIATCSKNRPPMLEKGMYDSWKIRIILYTRGKENGEMLKDTIDNSPYQLKPEITVKDTDGFIDICHPQRIKDLVGQEKLRYNSDIKAVNILLLGFPVDIHTLINHYQTAKRIWDRVKELIEGTHMTKQECESMLYDEFDKFTSEPGESIHSYYLRYAKLINDIKMIPMSMTPMQLNMKFVNRLQPEWSRFVTAVKQARDLHIVNFDQLYAFLKHNEKDAKEHYQSNTPITQQLIQSPPLQIYAPTVVQQPPIIQPDSEFVVPTFLPTDDPIASLNKAMIFLSAAYSSRYPPTNNQLQTSSNLRTQATIQNGQNQSSGARVINTVGNVGTNQPRVIRCYNCNGEVVLNDEQQDFLADSLEETDDFKDLQLQATANFKADHVDAYDSDCNDEATANAIFMANLSLVGSFNDEMVEPRYDSDILSEVPHYDTYHESGVLNSNIQELGYIENIVPNNESYDEIRSNNNVISYTDYMLTIGNDVDNYVPPPVQKNDMMLSVIEHMKTQVEKCNMVNQETQSVNESLTSELERYKDRARLLEYASKDGCSKKDALLNRELKTAICDRNRKFF
ncbi:hypothetical protein Tco_1420578 [Tanacetum coccineum]